MRSPGVFLADPLDVPRPVVEYLGGQHEIVELSCVASYLHAFAVNAPPPPH